MEACPKCEQSDKVEKFYTVEPQTLESVTSFVCMRCMCVVFSESGDMESVIYQVREQLNFS